MKISIKSPRISKRVATTLLFSVTFAACILLAIRFTLHFARVDIAMAFDQITNWVLLPIPGDLNTLSLAKSGFDFHSLLGISTYISFSLLVYFAIYNIWQSKKVVVYRGILTTIVAYVLLILFSRVFIEMTQMQAENVGIMNFIYLVTSPFIGFTDQMLDRVAILIGLFSVTISAYFAGLYLLNRYEVNNVIISDERVEPVVEEEITLIDTEVLKQGMVLTREQFDQIKNKASKELVKTSFIQKLRHKFSQYQSELTAPVVES